MRERRSYAYGDMDRQRVLRSVFAGLLRYAQSCTLVDAAKLVPVIMPYMQTNLDMDTLMQLAASAESLQAEQVVFTIPVLTRCRRTASARLCGTQRLWHRCCGCVLGWTVTRRT